MGPGAAGLNLVDFHNHLVPGVDDGAVDLEQSRAALRTMYDAGIRTIVATPHFNASLTLRPQAMSARLDELDLGWAALQELAGREFPDVALHRGVELMLDTPDPVLEDPRLRLAGTRFVLIEFTMIQLPPNSPQAISALRSKGVLPIVAHPERYAGMERRIELVSEWRESGGYIQVNAGSLVGRYGSAAQQIALELIGRGWVDYLSSDYHARGRLLVRSAREALARMGAEEQGGFLLSTNAQRMLRDETPWPLAPVARPGGRWAALTGLFRRSASQR